MSDLWMILVLLGVSIVLGVVLFNWWQEKKYRKDVEYRFDAARSDVLDANPAVGASASKKDLSEETEGWMSEPRVRGSARAASPATAKAEMAPKSTTAASGSTSKIEPSFTMKSSLPDQAADVLPTSVQKTAAVSLQAFTESSALGASVHMDDATLNDQVEAAALLDTQALDFEASTQTASLVDVAPVDAQPSAPEEASATLDASAGQSDVLPEALHLAMDWICLIDAPLGVMLAELNALQQEVRAFPQNTALWVQSAPETWENLLEMDKSSIQTHAPAQRLVCALQLADRGGPVDTETLKRFQKSMETLARGLGLQVQWLGNYVAEQQAQAIDAFAIEVDKAVEFHLMANQGMFHATKLRGLAEASGMYLSELGRFELVNAAGQLEFTLRNYEGKPFSAEMLKSAVMTGVTFQLDIPTTPDSLHVFDHMVEVANTMALSLNASLTDVNRKPIGEAQLGKIRQQLHSIASTMAGQGILPGSYHAQRLFS